MIRSTLLSAIVFFSFIACNSPKYQHSDESTHFEITFDINQGENAKASLIFEIALDSGYYFGSPHSKGHHQRLIFSIENTDSLLLDGELIEYPKTREEYDYLSDKQGKFVRVKTTYSQNLTIGSQNDFEVLGLVWLAMLPSYQPYEINFTITNKSGQLMVENISISTSDYPTFWDKKRVDVSRIYSE